MARAVKQPAKGKAKQGKKKPQPRAKSKAAAKPTPKGRPRAKAKAVAKTKAAPTARAAAHAATAAKARTTPPAAEAKPAAKARTTPPAAEAKPAAKARTTPPATEAKPAAKARLASRAGEPAGSISDAIPQPIGFEPSSGAMPRSLSARERAIRSSPVVEILDDPHPIGALRRFLDSIKGEATAQQAQIALGSAQLMLLPIARENRGGAEVKELVDLVVGHWDYFGDRRRGFHAQEFLRNALAAIGIDRERIAKLEDLIPPTPNAELLFNLACAHAVARDKVAMLRAVERALEAGISPTQFRRDSDFAVYEKDPDLALLLSRAEVPAIPVDVEPYLLAVREALDHLVATLREFGEPIELRPPVRLDAILDAERARKISLPNDYRALLTITNGMTVWDHTFFGAGDYREATPLAVRGQRYLEMSAERGVIGIESCVPVANWGQPNDWLLYDPRGRIRGGEPGYVLMLNADALPIRDLAAAIARIEYLARETLGTN